MEKWNFHKLRYNSIVKSERETKRGTLEKSAYTHAYTTINSFMQMMFFFLAGYVTPGNADVPEVNGYVEDEQKTSWRK